ncbi:cadherin-like domain-containing protein [Rhizobium sp. TH2]|uniref:cadherin-like domain-containing protein n=1 Tax=Rhizobium sp. TH2 TaxID=2775403 RepID=UPI002157ADC0|nr:cadherin-like domain-containing protein [Rhizobium sp. TH2]UVC07722.1 cadherin-like domain-containing protein [Rhizobium sp. TH2]
MGLVISNEYRVNTHTTNVQDSAQVTVLDNGGWVVTWRSYAQDHVSGSGVYQQIYNPDGTPQGGEVRVNTFLVGHQSLPQIATLSDGGWIITWRSDGQDGSSYGVYQQAFNADGTPQGVEQHVSAHTASDQNTPSVVALEDGGWVVTWQSNLQDGSGYGIYQQAYNADGTTRGTETRVNTYVTNSQELQQIIALPDGGWVIAWRSDGQDGSSYGVYQQVYNANGSARGVETQVNTYTSGGQEQPQFTLLPDGGWVVTWQSDLQDGSNYGIYQQVFNADGTKDGGEIQVNTNTGNYQYNAQVTTLLDGGWVVSWQSYTQDGSGNGVYQQAYNPDGTPQGGEVRVNSSITDSQELPQVAALSTGGWVVAWQSYLQDGSNGGIYLQAYKADGTPDGVETRVNEYTTGNQYNPQLTALSDGGWLVTWWSTGQDGDLDGVYQRSYRTGNNAPTGSPTASLSNGTEDTAYIVSAANLLAGFSDIDGDTLSVSNLTASNGATVVNNGNGTYTITLAANFNGTLTLNYNVVDGHGGTKAATQTVSVTPVNDAPAGSASASLAHGTEDSAYVVSAANLLAGFSDIDGDTLSVSGLSANGGATVVDNGNGTYTITPVANFNGTVTLSYTVIDGNGGTKPATQSVVFDAVNDAPTGSASASLAHGTEDTAYIVSAANLLAGFSDIDGDTLSVSGLSANGGATVVDNGDGTYTITPVANFNGTVTLSYNLIDGNGGTKPATQSVVFDAVNDDPTGSASASPAHGSEDTAYIVSAANLLAGFSDIDGDTLSVSGLSANGGATVVDNGDGTYTITPAANSNGTVTLSYSVIDGNGGSKAATQAIVFDAVNDAPTGAASASLAHGTEDTAYTVSAADLLAGFSDIDGDTLSVSGLSANGGATVVDNGDGTYTITPVANFNGTVTLSYTVIDGNGGTKPATQSVVFDAVNDAPTGSASASLAHGTEDTAYIVSAANLLAGFSDIDGDTLSVSGLSANGGATVVDNGDGTYTITPVANFNGTVTLSYNLIDGNGGTKPATQSVVFDAVNDDPTGSASASPAHGSEDTAYIVSAANLLAGFSDIDGDTLSVSGLSANGGATVVDNGDGTYTITPAANSNGTVTLSYSVIDGNGGSKAATQAIVFDAVNDAPTGSASASLAHGTEDTAYTVSAADLLAGFSDIDGDTLSVSGLSANGGATVVDNGDGTYTITPVANFNGTVTLSYNLIDGNGGTKPATQSVVFDAVNDAPTGSASASLAHGTEDTAYIVSAANLLAGFSDIDDDTLSVSGLSANGGATVVDNGDGTYTITPVANFNGTVTLSYNVIDGNGGTKPATQSVVFDAVNDDPTGSASASPAHGSEDTAYIVSAANLLAGFSDIDGDTLSVSNLTASNGATVVNNGNGTYTITLAANFNGTLTLNYNVVDGHGGTKAATQTVSVTPVNDAPAGSASASLAHGTEDSAYVVSAANLLAGFSDIDGDTLSVSGLSANGGATVVDNGNGTYTITPVANFNGTVTLSYTVIDGNGGTKPATQSVVFDAVNDDPTGSASASPAHGSEDTAYIVSAANLLAGFSDIDGDTLSVSGLSANGGATVVDNGDGTYTITPAANSNGTVTLSYSVIDGNGGSKAATQAIVFDAVNDAPTGAASASLAHGTEDTAYTVSAADLLAGFSDIDGDTLSVSGLSANGGATVVDNGDGTYTITPVANFNGTVTLSYTVIDGNGGTKPATQSVVFDAVNDAPTGSASASLAHGTEDTAYIVSAANLLAGFSDIDGDTLSVSGLSANGGATVVDNGDGTYTITPVANFNGTVTLSYNLIDGNGGTKPATQSVVFDAVNDDPTGSASASPAHGSEDTAYIVSAANLLAGFSDIDGDTLSVSGLSANGGATVVDNGDGTYTITPAANSNGTVTLSYSVIDGNGGSKAATQAIVFDAVNDAPTGSDKTISILEDTSYSFTVGDFGFTDIDGDAFASITITSLATSGELTLDGTAVTIGQVVDADDLADLVWKPAGNAFGDNLGSFAFNVTDDGGVAGGGEDTDDVARTITFDVTDVAENITGTKRKNNLVGGEGKDDIFGLGDKDTLTGNGGDDTLSGGRGRDIFVFGSNHGSDVITDFSAKGSKHDMLDLSAITDIDNWRDLKQNHMTEVDGDVVITTEEGVIVLADTILKHLGRDDFIL